MVLLLASFPVGIAVIEPTSFLIFSCVIVLYAIHYYHVNLTDQRNRAALMSCKEESFKYEQLINEHLPFGLAVITQDLNKIEFINDALRSRLHEDESIFLKNLQETLKHDPIGILPIFKATTVQSLEEREDLKVWHMRFNSDSGQRMCEIRRVKITWDGKPAYLVIVMETLGSFLMSIPYQNIKQGEEEAIASVSHEIRAPTNSIMSALEVASSKTSEPAARDMIKIARNSANFLLSIVNSFLDMGQISNNKMKLNFADVNVFTLIEEIREMMEFQTRSKELEFIVDYSDDMPSYISTDSDRLKQILINLLSNAVKFTSTGSITLGVNWDEGAPEVLEFYVKDTGTGIKEEDQLKLFKAYSRLEGNGHKELNKKGVGLGLLISMKLANFLGPESTLGIKIMSVYGKGSTFSFDVIDQNFKKLGRKLPSSSEIVGIELRGRKILESEIRNHSQKQARLFKKGSPRPRINLMLSNKTVLIVEDNPFNILAIKSILIDLNVQTLEAYNGEEAIKKVEQTLVAGDKIDLVFMDCFMPVMNGFETANRMKTSMTKNEMPSLPIIGLTADIRESLRAQCFESGMDDVITKPASKETIISVLKKWC